MPLKRIHRNPQMEFHISRLAREKYNFDESLFSLNGNIILGNFHAVRIFVQKMNAKRDLDKYPDMAIKTGHVNAMGLIDEILHFIIFQYRQQKNPHLWEKAITWLNDHVGREELEKTLFQFCDEFPPIKVYQQEIQLEEYLADTTDGMPNKHIALEELVMLWVANENPALSPYLELFDDRLLESKSSYPQLIKSLKEFINTQPKFGPNHENLIELLLKPAKTHPHSLFDQLKFIQDRWSKILGKFLRQLLSSLDLIREEEKPTFIGPGPSIIYKFTGREFLEEERFSPDLDWMPRLVLLAKNAFVWLDQLSKAYQRPITRLDEVPDDELDKLASWGINGLWLIGIWERSKASQRIKQLCGNPDAVSSAYSLFDYVISNRLGGDEALNNLRTRAWHRGIRLAADMVPNHVGIYSKWILEHPNWFISLDYNPFPTYSYNGENLSENERIGIFLEDHYYSREDAAVVFKRTDRMSGDVKYIYHGNDGTSMPWNDTAQLNYMEAEVREAVIQTILHVARNFPVIRFDAAMTLAKKHFQRLWFPQPGAGGDIPSRSDFGLTQEEFDQAMPMEFWREVVDRVAQEVPDTLLLAEAFWMMEGYFVRTLGMHRVYNSAFMNMLRDEKNAEYRQLIKNTLEFDPDILKRYVNFMNNPDEKTAIEQYGKDDKYFGICTLMVTMPGLPMFGHGQIEGYYEKYGMEYYRGYWDEYPNKSLVRRHEREIFPLLHRRYLFAGVDNFYLYDFYTAEGKVDENVFAFSNFFGLPGSNECQRALVIYHNRWADVRGWINVSAAFKDKSQSDDTLIHIDIGDGLGLQNRVDTFTIFRDHSNGLEYIHNNREIFEKGLYIELGAYKYQVFIDFREVIDNEWRQYAHLEKYLNGRGVPDMEESLQEIFLQPILNPFKEIVNVGFFQWLIEHRVLPDLQNPEQFSSVISEADAKLNSLFAGIDSLTGEKINREKLTREIVWKLTAALHLPVLAEQYPRPKSKKYINAVRLIHQGRNGLNSLRHGDTYAWTIIFSWIFTHNLGKSIDLDASENRSYRLIHDWLLEKTITHNLEKIGVDKNLTRETITCIKILIKFQNWSIGVSTETQTLDLIQSWLSDGDVQQYLKINTYEGVVYFNKEAMESLLRWMLTIGIISIQVNETLSGLRKQIDSVTRDIVSMYKIIIEIQTAAEESEYKITNFIEILSR